MFKRFLYLTMLYAIAFLSLRATKNEYKYESKSLNTTVAGNKDYTKKRLKVDTNHFELSVESKQGFNFVKGSFFIVNESRIKKYEFSFRIHLLKKNQKTISIVRSNVLLNNDLKISIEPGERKRVPFDLDYGGDINVKEIGHHRFCIHIIKEKTAGIKALSKAKKPFLLRFS